MKIISGILVVRVPEQNFDKEGRGAFSNTPPRIGNIFYGGIHRMQWFDLDEDYYNKTLPSDLLELWQSLNEDSRDFSGIRLCYDLQIATKVLDWSNREVNRNEIIVVRSQKLTEVKGKSFSLESYEVAWLGYDFIALGHWSLLEDGMFVSPSYFSRWNKDLNENGLVSDPSIIHEFAQDYSVAAKKGGVEPLPDDVYELEAIEIGRIHGVPHKR